jgi:hypothetical protein
MPPEAAARACANDTKLATRDIRLRKFMGEAASGNSQHWSQAHRSRRSAGGARLLSTSMFPLPMLAFRVK